MTGARASKASGYTLGGQRFATRDDVTIATRAIHDATAAGASVAERDLPFLLALLAHHDEWPEKSAGGVGTVTVPRDERGLDRFRLRRVDGAVIDISFAHAVKCLPDAGEPPGRGSTSARAVRAARAEIVDQLVAFRHAVLPPGTRCEVEGEALLAVNVDVDHVAPVTFERLLSGFCLSRGISLEDIATVDVDGRASRFADELLGRAWRRHHDAHARLGLVTRIGHRRVVVETRPGH